MLVTPLGIVIFVKPLQSKKVAAGIVVTLFPIFTVASFEQSPNIGLSDDPALVHAVAFQLTVVSPLQPEKAPLFNPVRTRDTVRTFYKYNIIF